MKIYLYKFLDKSLGILFFVLKLTSFKRKLKYKEASKFNHLMIIKLAAMGDVLALLPTLKQFHRLNPEFVITLVTTTRSSPHLYSDFSWLNVIAVDGSVRGVFRLALSIIFYYSKRVDVIFNFDQYYRVSELISLSCGRNASFQTGRLGAFSDITVRYDPKLNEKLMFYKLFEKGIRSVYNLSIGPYEHIKVTDFFSGNSVERKRCMHRIVHVAIYPGSSNNAKFRRWPPTKYIELINRLPSNWRITILGGPDEVGLVPIFQSISNNNIKILINVMTLAETAKFLYDSVDILVGNDGGLLHVADVLHIPTVAIFGPSLGCKWGPIQKNSKIVEVDHVDCRPCIKNYEGTVPQSCARSDTLCLQSVTCEMVENEIIQLCEEVKC